MKRKVDKKYCWAITRGRGGHGGGYATAEQVPLCYSWTSSVMLQLNKFRYARICVSAVLLSNCCVYKWSQIHEFLPCSKFRIVIIAEAGECLCLWNLVGPFIRVWHVVTLHDELRVAAAATWALLPQRGQRTSRQRHKLRISECFRANPTNHVNDLFNLKVERLFLPVLYMNDPLYSEMRGHAMGN